MKNLILQCAGIYMAALLPTLALSNTVAEPVDQSPSTGHEHTSERAFFIPNVGQWDDPSLYHFRSGPLHIYLEPQGFTYILSDYSPIDDLHAQGLGGHELGDVTLNHHAFRMRFAGASKPVASGRGKQKGYHNYFIGNDQSKWKSEVPLFQGVHLQNLYPGIDLEAKSKAGALKYDIVVSPGADPSQVRMQYSGLDGLSIEEGKLMLHTSLGTLEEHIPLAWQEMGGRTVVVPCMYTLEGDVASFHFPEGYDPEATLIIDPVLIAATLSGTTGGSNFGHGATYDLEGNIFTHAISFDGTTYPVTEGAFQTTKVATVAVLTKFDPLATDLIWASYLGGSTGTLPHSIVTNNQGELYVYGTTSCTDFPVSPWAFQSLMGGETDIYVSHFNMNGTALLGSTYIGGSAIDGRNNTSSFGHDALRGEIVVDGMGNAYVATATRSSNFPTSAGCFQSTLEGGADGVVFKLSSDMSTLHWSTLLGGSMLENTSGLRVKDNGHVVVSGMSNSDDFPMPTGGFQETKAAGYDAFVVEINADGSDLEKGTFAGTESDDYAFFVDQNVTGISIYGISQGDWPVTPGAYNTGGRTFVTRFNNDLTELLLSARIGGSAGALVAFMVDLCGRSYMSMYNVGGMALELTPDALYSSGGFYISVLDENLEELIFGTYGQGSHVDGGTSRFDPKGIIYQGVCSGSGSMQGTPGAWAVSQNVGWDIGVFKIDFGISTTLAAGAVPNPIGCIPHTVEFENYSEGTDFIWDFGDGSPISVDENPSHVYDLPGTYEVILIAMDSTSCNLSDTTFIYISVGDPFEFTANFDYNFDCESLSLELINLTDPTDSVFVYSWNMGDGNTYGSFEPTHQYENPGNYTVTLNVFNPLCFAEESSSIEIPIFSNVDADAQSTVVDFCLDATVAFTNTSTGGVNFEWLFGDGNQSDQASPEHTYDTPGEYEVTLIISDPQSCNIADTLEFTVSIPEPPIVQADIIAQQSGNCADLGIDAQSTSLGDIESYVWLFNGDTLGFSNPITGNVDEPGSYELTLLVTESICGFTSDTTVVIDLINSMESALEPDYNLCYNIESIEVSAISTVEDATYYWLPSGEETPNITVTEPGTYQLIVTAGTCVDSLQTVVNDGIMIPTGYSFEACDGFPVEINIDFPFVFDPLWADGHTEAEKVVTQAGDYDYSFTDHQGCRQDGIVTFVALPENPLIEVPNIFTPNGDGMNDTFLPQGGTLQLYSLSVLNRWGTELFRTESIYGPWNGRIMGDGDFVNEGSYFYILHYQGECQRSIQSTTGYIQVNKHIAGR